MDESLTNLPSSHRAGSVPGSRFGALDALDYPLAVIDEEREITNYEVSEETMQMFPPNNGRREGSGGYQTLGSSSVEGFEQQPANNWRGLFSISSYTQYFNVDTDIFLNRLVGSLYPNRDFSSKIDANPDLYGLVWISTTLLFVLGSLGNCATYLMKKRSDKSISWSFDVGYMNVAAISVYGYVILVPLAFFFLLQYLGTNSNLVRFWCMWGYSLFIFIPTSLLLLIPVEIVRWIIILLIGGASASFVALNLRSYVEGSDLALVLIAAFLLQLALAVFFKMWFFS